MQSTQKFKTLHGTGWLLQLPEELLWTIMGFLDVRGLLTARLVCKQFCKSASGHFKGLEINCVELKEGPASNFLHFSGLVRVAVSVSCADRLYLLAQPRIGPLVTHVNFRFFSPLADLRALLAPVNRLPKLRSICVSDDWSRIPLLPRSLQELHLCTPLRQDASPLTCLSELASLDVTMSEEAAPSLVKLAGLLSLRSLALDCWVNPTGVLNNFTMLTSLSLRVPGLKTDGNILSDLAHLSRLAHLSVSVRHSVTRGDLACLSPLTKLTCLDIHDCNLADCARDSSALVPLTGLVSLGLNGGYGSMSLLRHVKVEALQSLVLQDVTDISVLGRVTGLTGLEFTSSGFGGQYDPDLGPALAKMSRLRSLSLILADVAQSAKVFHLSPVLQASTGPTKLVYRGDFAAGTDMQACASLPLLRTLELLGTREVTPALLPVLQGMSSLTKLGLSETGIHRSDLTPEVRAAFDAERLSRGWRRLKLVCD